MLSLSGIFAQNTQSSQISFFSKKEGIQSFSQFKANLHSSDTKKEKILSDTLNPSDSVSISKEAQEKSQALTKKEESRISEAFSAMTKETTKTFESGTKVSVSPSQNSEGFYTASISYSDGRASEEIQIKQDTVFSEDSSGNLIIKKAEENKVDADSGEESGRKEKRLLGTDSDDFIVSVSNNSKISASKGNDTLLILGENTSASLGDGDNTVISRGGNVSVSAGDGNNLFSLAGMNNTVNMGDGNNTLYSYDEVKLNGGDGNNEVKTMLGTINLGDGNNRFETIEDSRFPTSVESVKMGNGSNSIVGKTLNNLTTGAGNNTISLDVSSNIHLGNGNNELNIERVRNLTVGSGDNNLDVDVLTKSLYAGDGNNDIKVNATYDKDTFLAYKELEKYEGINDPNFKVSSASIDIGNGNNSIEINDTVHDVIARNSEDSEHIRMGSGNIHIGSGNNEINISSFGSSEQGEGLYLGNGNNSLTVEKNSEKASVNMGDGINKLNFIKGQNNLDLQAGSGHTELEMGDTTNNLNFVSEGSANIAIKGDLVDSSLDIGENMNENGEIDSEIEGEITSQVMVEGNVVNSEITTKGKASIEVSGFMMNSSLISENVDKDSSEENLFNIEGGIFESEIEGFESARLFE